MTGKALKDKLISGERVFGTFFQNAVNPAMVDFLPPGAFDFAIVTAEHNALELAEFLPIRYALAAKGIACLVRIHSRDPADVSKVCDTFDGVVVPYVEDVDNAKQLAAAAVYRPLKGKLLDRVLAGGAWPSEASKEYIEQKNADTVFIPMIESVPAVENLDEICSIPGVHAVFVGPGDLTCSMGIPTQYDHPDLIATIKRVIETADRYHVAAGCWFGERRQAVRTIRQGARLVVYANDALMLRDEMVTLGEVMKQAGYATSYTGKWYLGSASPKRPIDRGFEEYYGLLSGCCNFFNPAKPDPVFYNGGKLRPFAHNDKAVTQFPEGYYTTDAFTDHAIKTIRQHGASDKPFFHYLCYTAPHFPLHAPEEGV